LLRDRSRSWLGGPVCLEIGSGVHVSGTEDALALS